MTVGITIAVLILTIILGVNALGVVLRWRFLNALRSAGREISADEAVARVERGNGVIVENYTGLAGAVWWIDCNVDDWTLPEVVKERGCLVKSTTHDEIRLLLAEHGLAERIRRLDFVILSD